MKEALIDIAQAGGCYVGSFLAVGVASGLLGVAAPQDEPAAYLLAIGGWIYSMVRVSRWRQARRVCRCTPQSVPLSEFVKSME